LKCLLLVYLKGAKDPTMLVMTSTSRRKRTHTATHTQGGNGTAGKEISRRSRNEETEVLDFDAFLFSGEQVSEAGEWIIMRDEFC